MCLVYQPHPMSTALGGRNKRMFLTVAAGAVAVKKLPYPLRVARVALSFVVNLACTAKDTMRLRLTATA